jgi:hypothetical protein
MVTMSRPAERTGERPLFVMEAPFHSPTGRLKYSYQRGLRVLTYIGDWDFSNLDDLC